MGKLTVTASTAKKVDDRTILLFASATNESGAGAKGLAKNNFKLHLLDPPEESFPVQKTSPKDKKFKIPEIINVEDLDNGYYKISCFASTGFPMEAILGLRVLKLTGGMGFDGGQTIVSILLS